MFKRDNRMICLKCGADTFIKVDVGLKCENCGYVLA